jgi:hypothetical protein
MMLDDGSKQLAYFVSLSIIDESDANSAHTGIPASWE